MDISKMDMIGSGAEADIYLFDHKAIKIFKNERLKSDACREAEFQRAAHIAGLPVPAIYEVTEIDGKAAIIMEYIEGKTVGLEMLENFDKAPYYLKLSVDLQMKIHELSADDFPCQKEAIKNNIVKNPYLENSQKNELLGLLNSLISGDRLCHGDFHVLNLLQAKDCVKILDWVCASKGNILADVCRTYLLYLLYRSEIAEIYIDIYCGKSGILKRDVLVWLPLIAGARLNENVTEKDVALLLGIVSNSCAK